MNWVFRGPVAARCAHWPLLLSWAVIFVTALQPRFAEATYFPLVDGNSLFEIETQQQAMAFGWKVDGVEHMQELSNWYRISRIGTTNVINPETSAHQLSLVSESFNSPSSMTVTYTDNDLFQMEITFTIIGGAPGSGYSEMGECVRITNISNMTNTTHGPVPIAFHFFEYIDLDLDDTPNDDEVSMIGPTTVHQVDLTSGTVFTGNAATDRYELDFVDTTLNKLKIDGVPSNLAFPNSGWPVGAGPVGPNSPPPSDPPNVAWALQFNFAGQIPPRPAIQPGETVEICKVCQLQMAVPEPTSGIVAICGFFPLALARRWRRS
jgi:hypothetical protein